MLHKTVSTQPRRKFLHEEEPKRAPNIGLVRPPTSHAYSALRHMRTPQTGSRRQHMLLDLQRNKSGTDLCKMQGRLPEHKIPKSIQHFILQVKLAMKGVAQEEMRQADAALRRIAKRVAQMEEQIGQLEEKLKKQVLEVQTELPEEIRKKKKKIEMKQMLGRGGQNSLSEMEIMLEKVRLQQLSSAYEAEYQKLIKRIETPPPSGTHNQLEQDDTEVLRYRNRIKYLQMCLQRAEEREVEVAAKEQSMKEQIERLAQRVRDGDILLESKEEQRNQWRERAIMGLEDGEMQNVRRGFLLFSIKKLRESNRILTQKIIVQGGESRQQVEPNSHFQYQVDFFKRIRSTYFQEKLREFQLSLQGKLGDEKWKIGTLDSDYMSYRRHQDLELAGLRYSLPTFYSLIQESLGDPAAWRAKASSSVSRIFVQVLRSILLSKANEFLYQGQERPQRFPQFVFGWFEKFYFNSEKEEVCSLEPYMQKPFPQSSFYRDLMNPRLDQSWEVITFREFLIEQLSLQELYFYLACQSLLFRRAGITRQVQLRGEFTLYAEYSSAHAVLELILADFQGWNLTFLTTKLREKVIYRAKAEYIDCAFFLRCLVEYYKVERVNRYKYLCRLCSEFSSEQHMRFTSFLAVINRFASLPIQDKVALYRDCHCVGKGKITPQIVFAVATERLVFLKYLRLKTFYSLPLLISKPRKPHTLICIQPPHPYLYSIYSNIIGLLGDSSQFLERLQHTGVQELVQSVVSLRKVFGDKAANENSSVLQGRHFLHFISQSLSVLRAVTFQGLYQLLEEQYKRKSNSDFYLEIDQEAICAKIGLECSGCFEGWKEVRQQIIWKDKVYRFRLNHAARKIQRMVRKKFIVPFLELYKIIYSDLKIESQP